VSASDVPIIHEGLALIHCRDATVLKEILLLIDRCDVDLEIVGDRALVLPTRMLDAITTVLHSQGIYPRIIGLPARMEEAP
jgi:hypothetical protein